MIIVERILGNPGTDADLAQQMQGATIDIVVLEQWEAQKSRCRKRTLAGRDIGIALDRHQLLRQNDILFFELDTNTYIQVKITLPDVMVVDLNLLSALPIRNQIEISFELGHALGNQHWKAISKENKVYVPVTISTTIMHRVMQAHHFAAAAYQFVPGDRLLDLFSNAERRLLFGGAENEQIHVHVATDAVYLPRIKLN